MVKQRVQHCSIRGGRAGQWAVWRHSLHTHDMTWRHEWLNKECDPSIFSRPAGCAKTRIDSNSLFYSRTRACALQFLSRDCDSRFESWTLSGFFICTKIKLSVKVFFLAKFQMTILSYLGDWYGSNHPLQNCLFIVLLFSKGGNNHKIQLLQNVHIENSLKAYNRVKN